MSLYHLPYRKEKGPENMATDVWLLGKAESWGGQAFRRYGWASPQITFGYGQKFGWVEKETGKDLAVLIRRPTGGGIVHHGTDLTYSMVFMKGSRGEQMPLIQLYGLIHQRWGDALDKQNIHNCLMPCSEKSPRGIPGNCFKEPVGRDLMDGEGAKKLAGAAMKRTRKGVLVQGSLELGDWPELDHSVIEMDFLKSIAEDLDEKICPMNWSNNLEAERIPLVATFSSICWTQKRKNP